MKATTTNGIVSRFLSWVGDRPWIMQLWTGLLWLFLIIVGIGKGQDWSVFVGFLGMLWWALLTRDYEDMRHDLKRAMTGWSATIEAWTEEIKSREKT